MIPVGDVSVSTSCECIARYQWVLDNYWICCKDVGDALLSPEFLAAHDSNPVVWSQLQFYPKGTTEQVQDYFSLFVKIVRTTAEIAEVSLSIFLNGVELVTRQFHEPTRDDTRLWGAEEFMHRNLIRDEANRPLPSDILTIVFKIKTRKSEEKMSVLQSRIINTTCEIDDYEQLIDDKDYSDVVLIIGNRSLRAHKSILSKRSAVFGFIFKAQNGDERSNRIKICDFKYEVCLEMLRYIYAEKVNNIETMDYELLAAANKYGIMGLKLMCEKSLCRDVNIDNVIDKLEFAYQHGAEMLKCITIGFIHTHEAEIMDRPEYQNLSRKIAFDILYTAVNRTR